MQNPPSEQPGLFLVLGPLKCEIRYARDVAA